MPSVFFLNINSSVTGSMYQPSRSISLSSCRGAQPEKPA
jgi:hypothetical protein